ncbi:MAG: hypothetical protein ACRETN_05750 [Nevskiales bacterium]
MTLVERFIEINGWSTSRKTALLSGLGLLFHVFGSLVVQYSFSQLPWVDLHLINLILWPWALSLALCCLISSMVAKRGHEGRWTFWLFLISYGAFMVAVAYLVGLTSTALFAWYPLIILLVALWYGPIEAAYIMGYVLVLLALTFVLQSSGLLPFAPALLNRNIDVQQAGFFSGSILFAVMLVFAFCFTLVLLVLAARRLQQTKLDEAHQKLDRSVGLIRRYVLPSSPTKSSAASTPKSSSPSAPSSPSSSPMSKASPTPPTSSTPKTSRRC